MGLLSDPIQLICDGSAGAIGAVGPPDALVRCLPPGSTWSVAVWVATSLTAGMIALALGGHYGWVSR